MIAIPTSSSMYNVTRTPDQLNPWNPYNRCGRNPSYPQYAGSYVESSDHSWSGAMARNNSPGTRFPSMTHRSANQRYDPPAVVPNDYSTGYSYYHVPPMPMHPVNMSRPMKIERPSRNVASVNQVIDISSEDEELDENVVMLPEELNAGMPAGVVQIEVSASVYHPNDNNVEQYFGETPYEENGGDVYPYLPVDFSERNRGSGFLAVRERNGSSSNAVGANLSVPEIDVENANDGSDEPMNLSNRMKRSSDEVINVSFFFFLTK